MTGTRLIDFESVFALSESAGCEIVRAILHSILFVRALGVVVPREMVAHLDGVAGECYYTAIDDDHIEYRVDRAVQLAKRAMSGAFQVVEIELEFGALDHEDVRRRKADKKRRQGAQNSGGQIIKKVSNWASWVTDSLASVGKTAAAAAGQDADQKSSFASAMRQEDDQLLTRNVARIWERWKFRVYVVDEKTYRRVRRPALPEILDQVVEYSSRLLDDLPPIITSETITYPFRTHVREAHAMSEPFRTRGSTRPIAIGGGGGNERDRNRNRRSSDAVGYLDGDAASSGWWGSMRFSPGSGTWEDGMGLLRDLVQNAPALSSSPPF